MNQPRMPSPAILVAVLALVVALAGTALADMDATTSAVSKKQFKKLTKQVNELQAQVDALSSQPGPQGGQGASGEDATKLFGYIADQGAVSVVGYGSGVTAVTDPSPGSTYTVTFNQSVTNCVVQVSPGVGDPVGGGLFVAGSPGPGSPAIEMNRGGMNPGGADEVDVLFRDANGSSLDTSFFVTAFC